MIQREMRIASKMHTFNRKCGRLRGNSHVPPDLRLKQVAAANAY